MALDGAFLSCIRRELEQTLLGSRIDKIHQPAREELLIAFRGREGSAKLRLSASANSARAHLTALSVENPKSPPMFCMLLRKHLGAGRLAAIRQEGLERILSFDFACTNEMGDAVTLTLVCEIMGRHSNIILVGEDGRVIDCIKRVDEEMSVRRMLPGVRYAPPPAQEGKLSLLDCTEDDFLAAVEHAPGGELAKAFAQAMQGISPVVAREAAYYAAHDTDVNKRTVLDDSDRRDRLVFFLRMLRKALDAPHFTMLAEPEGKPRDFSFLPVSQYGAVLVSREYASAGELLDAFYAERDRIDRVKQRSHDLLTLLANTSARVARRLAAQKEELARSVDREELRIRGDLVNANLYTLEKGMTSCTLANFYEESAPPVSIPLDPRLTPAQNAQKLYAEYRKADTAERKLREQIAMGEEELTYVDSVFDALTRAEGESDLAEIRQELSEQGYLRRRAVKGKDKLLKGLPPMHYASADGFTILVGRNNRQNDKLTLKEASKTDLWLHTKDIPGSHVIIRAEGKPVPDSTIEHAARIAAYHSKARDSAQVPVDYTQVRYVRKPMGAKPGMVIFDHNRTLYVRPGDGSGDFEQEDGKHEKRA